MNIRCFFLIIIIFFSVTLSADSSKYNVKHKTYQQLDSLNKKVLELLERLYGYVHSCDDWRGSRYSNVNKIGLKIDKYILQRNSEEAALRLESQREACLILVRELASILPDIKEQQLKLKNSTEVDLKDNIQAVVIFLGETISQISGIKCPIRGNIRAQLDTYDLYLKKLKYKFYDNRLKHFIPAFLELYREKFIVTIWSVLFIGMVIVFTYDKVDWKKRSLNTYNFLKEQLQSSFESLQEASGWKSRDGKNIMDIAKDNIKSDIKIICNIPGLRDYSVFSDEGIKELDINYSGYIQNMKLAIDDWSKKMLDPKAGLLHQLVENGDISQDKFEEAVRKLLDIDFIKGKFFTNTQDKNLKIMQTVINTFLNRLETLFSLGTAKSQWYDSLIVNTELFFYNLAPILQKINDVALWLHGILPVIPLSLLTKKTISKFKNSVYESVEYSILNIDQVISKYSDNKPFLKADIGLLSFWIYELSKDANSISVSREDRKRILYIIEQIQTLELPNSQKLRTIDIHWRFRKAM